MEEEGNGIGRGLGCLHGVATLFAPLSFPFLRLPIRLGPKVEVERSSRVEDRHRLVEESDHPMDRWSIMVDARVRQGEKCCGSMAPLKTQFEARIVHVYSPPKSPLFGAFFLPSIFLPLRLCPSRDSSFAPAPRSCLLSLRALRVEAFLPSLELVLRMGWFCFCCWSQGPPFRRASSCPFGFCLLCFVIMLGFLLLAASSQVFPLRIFASCHPRFAFIRHVKPLAGSPGFFGLLLVASRSPYVVILIAGNLHWASGPSSSSVHWCPRVLSAKLCR
jgi:hypothetical protein